MADTGKLALAAYDLVSQLAVRSANLFNKNDVIMGAYYYTNGTLNNSAPTYNTPRPIKIQGGKTYETNVSGFGNVVFWDANMTVAGSLAANTWNKTIAVPANASYLVFPIPSTFDMNTLMLTESPIPVTYVPYGYITQDTITPSPTGSFVSKNDILTGPIGRNLFDKSKIRTGYEVYSDGQIVVQATASAVTDYMSVSGLTDIYISGLTAYAAGLSRVSAFYDQNKVLLGTTFTLDRTLTEFRVIVPANAMFFVLTVYQRQTSTEVIDLNTIQVEAGTRKTVYEDYRSGATKVKGVSVLTYVPTVPKTSGKNFLLFGDSITETATVSDDGATYTEATRSNWPTFSKNSLAMGQLWNYAKSGATYIDRTVGGSITARQMISTQVNTAIANGRLADIIVVAIGINDTSSALGDYTTAMGKTTLASLDRTNLYEAIRWTFWTLRNNYPNAMCYTSTPMQVASQEPVPAVRDAIIKMANRYNFIVIDAAVEVGIVKEFEVVGGAGRYLYDGIHPNTAGQQLMSKLFDRVILSTYNL